uniref:Venom protein 29 n=1 Tax=Lychas mucronatus TaxID=172552 RepID=VP29_LYCMC|nr:RecName: Full=Venom protein 29; Flags: Precursor [Lychas mucronatus]
MNKLFLFTLLVTLWSVKGFTYEEKKQAFCSLPKVYQIRLLDCLIDRGSENDKEVVNAVYKCMNEHSDVDGKADAMMKAVCNEEIFATNRNLILCMLVNPPKLEHSERTNDDDLEAVKYCLVNG